MGDDAATTEEISQYNQRARRNRTVEDHHGGALAVGELHGAHPVGGRRQPGPLYVEGKETVPRESASRPLERGGGGPIEEVTPKQLFPSTSSK